VTDAAAGAVAKQLLPLPLLCRPNRRRGDGAHVIPICMKQRREITANADKKSRPVSNGDCLSLEAGTLNKN